MPDVQVRELHTRTIPVSIVPDAQEALQEASLCLDTAGQALRGAPSGSRRVERTDEVIALLQAAASHLETAWDMATGGGPAMHLHGAE